MENEGQCRCINVEIVANVSKTRGEMVRLKSNYCTNMCGSDRRTPTWAKSMVEADDGLKRNWMKLIVSIWLTLKIKITKSPYSKAKQ